MTKYIIVFATLFSMFSCTGDTVKDPNIYEGEFTLGVDESLQKVMKAQIAAYKMHYPKATINLRLVPEQRAIALLLKDSITAVATTRGFNENELAVMKSRGIKYLPARMAIDAVALITNKAFPDSTISIEKLKILLTDKNAKTKLIFDDGNSSNLNIIMSKIGISDINKENIYAAGSNMAVVEYITKNPNAIGFLGYNWISDTDDPKVRELKSKFNILGVSDSTKTAFRPTLKNIKDRNYPLERFVFFHTLKKDWGLENGFVRFSCSKIGQLVTEKMGLVPFYKIPKEYLLNTESMNSLQTKAQRK